MVWEREQDWHLRLSGSVRSAGDAGLGVRCPDSTNLAMPEASQRLVQSRRDPGISLYAFDLKE